MTEVVVGWTSQRPLDSGEIQLLLQKVAQRYQVLFKDELGIVALHSRHRGLACIGVNLENSFHLHSSNEQLVCLLGNPSITTPLVSEKGTPGAKELFDLVRDPRDASRLSPLINPPWSVWWFDKPADQVGCLTDGLGLSRVFLAELDGITCFSNKCWPITQHLGKSFPMNQVAWAHWFTQGWFPGTATAFEDIQIMGPGEHRSWDAQGARLHGIDSLSQWLAAGNVMDVPSLLDAATSSFSNFLGQQAAGNCTADLTGGIDSRAICAGIMAHSGACEFITGGRWFSDDVIIARKIASRFRLDWRSEESLEAEMDPEAATEATRLRFEKMTLWDEGNVEPNRFEHFPTAGVAQDLSVNLNGSGSEISRAFYYSSNSKGGADDIAADAFSTYRAKTRSKAANILLEAGPVHALLDQGLFAGNRYHLGELGLLDFYYLNERIRRWYQAHLCMNLTQTSRSPFLTVDHIRLAFAFSPRAKARSEFQFHLIKSFCPELLSLPINEQIGLSLQWRWRNLPRVRNLLQPTGGPSRIARVLDYSLERHLPADSPIWGIIKASELSRCFKEFSATRSRHYFFVLRVMAFEAWRKHFH
jgi:asparagine synthetase B (glutamine-hydrolysing)